MHTLLEDFRYGLRMLRKHKGATAIAVLAMALGIGVNVATFSTVDGLLWKPLPYPDLDRLVLLGEAGPAARRSARDAEELAAPTFLDWKRQIGTLDHVAAYQYRTFNLTGDPEPERVEGHRVSAALFRAMGVPPALGRVFSEDEERPGDEAVAVLSHGLWQRRFAGDPAVIGRTLRIDDREHTIIGVMPPKFQFPLRTDLWIPLAFSPAELANRGAHSLLAVAKLKPGVTLEQAQGEVARVARRIEEQWPQFNKDQKGVAGPLATFIVTPLTRQFSMMAMGAVFLVLLVACANVASLGFVQAGARTREIALRAALGASSWRVARLLLSQSLLLAFAGAALGLLVAMWDLDLTLKWMPPDVAKYLAGWNYIRLDGRALLFAAGLAVLSGVLAGVAPALAAARPDLNRTLKEGGRGASGGGPARRMGGALVAVEMALAVVLLAGAGLLVKGFRTLALWHLPIEPDTLLTLRVEALQSRFPTPRQVADFGARAVEALSALPGVRSAAMITHVPYGRSRSSYHFEIEGAEALPAGMRRLAQLESVTPGALPTLGLPVRAGRDFAASDAAGAAGVAIVNEALVRRYFTGRNPLGHVLTVDGARWTVAGIAPDMLFDSTDREIRPVLYRPMAQAPTRRMDFVVRTSGPAAQLATSARQALRRIEPDQPIARIDPLRSLIEEERAGFTHMATLMSALGAIALLLASMGVYGVTSFAVSQRTPEIGIRMALGAAPGSVVGMVIGSGLKLAGAGLAAGLVAAYALARLLAGLLFGVSPNDLVTYAAAAAVLLAAALAACFGPARKASRVDPVTALRHD